MSNNDFGLKNIGIVQSERIKRNLPVERLVEDILINKEGEVGLNGAVMVDTGQFTGRSPLDKYIVDEPSSNQNIWWGDVNRKIKIILFPLKRFSILLKNI